jgi:hypothetical protein
MEVIFNQYLYICIWRERERNETHHILFEKRGRRERGVEELNLFKVHYTHL